MENKQIVKFNMYEMEYIGNSVKSNLPIVPFNEKYYEQYKRIINDCFYEMRKELNIKPYENHNYTLEELSELKENTFLLLNGEEIISAVTCSENDIKRVVVNLKYQRQGYGRKIMLFAVNYLQNRGSIPIKLTVTKWNENAIILYKSQAIFRISH